MFMIMLQMVNHLSIWQKITGKTEERPAQGQNEGCTNQPPSRKCNILVKHGKL